jgi:hypothetical protein
MKKNKIFGIITSVVILLSLFSCSDLLEEEVYSQLSDEYLKTEEGLNTIVYTVYSGADFTGRDYAKRILLPFYSSGHGWGKGGTFESAYAVAFRDFTWDSNNEFFSDQWNKMFTVIRNANLVLDKLEGGEGDYSDDYISSTTAEMKALRGYCYALLYNFFGTVPIFTTTEDSEYELPRATDDEMLAQIETDLIEAAAVLPAETDEYGRVTKGAALAFLCKHYLNTQQWQNCADIAEDIIDLDAYSLIANYADIFGVENEENEELIWVHIADAVNKPEKLLALVLPTDYPLLSTQKTNASRTYVNDTFIDSYDDNDTRKEIFIKSYVNTKDKTITGYGNDQSLCLKFEPDPNAVGVSSGIDLPDIRYADILLSRAEALNEISGPTQESIDLINEIRIRAGVDEISLNDFSQDDLRDFILEERFKEFCFEGKEREDLIRQGKFISTAVANGINAKDYHVLYPIPQEEIDANSNINENNTGY